MKINNLARHCNSKKYDIEYFYHNQNVKHFTTIPKTSDLDLHWIFKKYLCEVRDYKIAESYITKLDGVKIQVYNKLGSCKLFTKYNELIESESTNYRQRDLDFNEELKLSGLSFCLLSDSSSVFFHWIYQSLPRINLLNKSKYFLDDIENFIVPEDCQSNLHISTLKKLGISEEKILKTKPGQLIECESMVISSLPTKNIYVSSWVYNFIKTNFFSGINKRFRKIYISREKASCRKILNEDEVFSFLKKMGFKKIYIEDYSLEDQAQIFNGAEEIVTPHGSSLANLVFCRPRTKVLEFFNPNYVMPLYWSISNDLDLDYAYLIGEGKRPKEGEDPHKGKENILLNLEKLKKYFN